MPDLYLGEPVANDDRTVHVQSPVCPLADERSAMNAIVGVEVRRCASHADSGGVTVLGRHQIGTGCCAGSGENRANNGSTSELGARPEPGA